MTKDWQITSINPNTGEVSLKHTSGDTISAMIPPESVHVEDKMAYLEEIAAHRDASRPAEKYSNELNAELSAAKEKIEELVKKARFSTAKINAYEEELADLRESVANQIVRVVKRPLLARIISNLRLTIQTIIASLKWL